MLSILENQTTEYKMEVNNNLKKEIIAFANTDGGTIYIGVADDGSIVGVNDVDSVILQVSAQVRDGIRPDVTMFVHYGSEMIEDRNVVKIIVERGIQRPYYLAGKGIRPESVYVRQGSASVPASMSAIRMMIKQTDGDVFENMRSFKQELSFDNLTAEFKKRNLNLEVNHMRSLGICNGNDVFTNLGLILSDQNPSTIKSAYFYGTKKVDFQDRAEFTGALLQQMNDAYQFLDKLNRTKATFSGLYRTDTRDYPEVAVREALLNTLIHREYSFSGSTMINVYSDRMEFIFFGGLVEGITMEDIMMGVSSFRNEHLAAVLYRLKLIEAYGTGIPKIFEAYEHMECQPKIETSDNAFKITIPNVNYVDPDADKNKVVNLITNMLHEGPMAYTVSDEVVVDMVKEKGRIYRSEAQEKLGVSTTMAGRIIKRLVDRGVLSPVGNGRSRFYILK